MRPEMLIWLSHQGEVESVVRHSPIDYWKAQTLPDNNKIDLREQLQQALY